MLRYRKDFYSSRYDAARKDGMSMERLQASPYVLDIYGYCGVSSPLDTAPFGISTFSLASIAVSSNRTGRCGRQLA